MQNFSINKLRNFLNAIESFILNSSPVVNRFIEYCESISIETPIFQLKHVVSYDDLLLIENSVNGTIFQIKLSRFFKETL